jgi:hypothetical protein
MVTVSAKCGFTLKLWKDSSYEFIRPEASIEGIDPNGDIEEQIKQAIPAALATWEGVTEVMNKIIAQEMPNVDAEMSIQIGKKLQGFEKRLKEVESWTVSKK